ncbi:hypothetical protein F383_39049 [Gossypium arboreum]|uniref:Uncharacterized protein n=1 Tax=Gossypium arboreum TaxID=29729 RepID=A0A0B0MJS7_GOSAR|nr:hypothetical protein F383_39049 [Gossypium arboreum]
MITPLLRLINRLSLSGSLLPPLCPLFLLL